MWKSLREGHSALVSLSEKDGAILVPAPATFAEVTRLSIGEYSGWDMGTSSAGINHQEE